MRGRADVRPRGAVVARGLVQVGERMGQEWTPIEGAEQGLRTWCNYEGSDCSGQRPVRAGQIERDETLQNQGTMHENLNFG